LSSPSSPLRTEAGSRPDTNTPEHVIFAKYAAPVDACLRLRTATGAIPATSSNAAAANTRRTHLRTETLSPNLAAF
jgi:hypothetical protein